MNQQPSAATTGFFNDIDPKQTLALSSEANKPTVTAKPKRAVTLKHPAAASAEEHQLTKRASETLLGDLVEMITKHLKKGERAVLRASASKKVAFRATGDLKMVV